MTIGLLILRLVFGITLVAHAVQKLFGWFGGGGIAGTAPLMEKLGFRPGRLQAVLAGLVEAGGGLLLAAGLFSPLAAAMIIAVMLVASVTVHFANGFFVQKGGYEYNLTLAAGALALAFTGPGALSLDAALGIAWSGPVWGMTALALGLLGGGSQLLTRSRRSPAQVSAQKAVWKTNNTIS
jgi:putative oxidoreductase